MAAGKEVMRQEFTDWLSQVLFCAGLVLDAGTFLDMSFCAVITAMKINFAGATGGDGGCGERDARIAISNYSGVPSVQGHRGCQPERF